MQIPLSLIGLAALVAAIPPPCIRPPPYQPTPCNLKNSTAAPCDQGQFCVPASLEPSDIGVCAGKFCAGFAAFDGENCHPCPQTQACTYNFSTMPELPGYCALEAFECAGPDNKKCPEGRNWDCVSRSDSACGNPSETCAGLCRPS